VVGSHGSQRVASSHRQHAACFVMLHIHAPLLTLSVSNCVSLTLPLSPSPISPSLFHLRSFYHLLCQSTQFLLPLVYIDCHSILDNHLSPTIPLLVSMSTRQTQLGEASLRVPVTGSPGRPSYTQPVAQAAEHEAATLTIMKEKRQKRVVVRPTKFSRTMADALAVC
jgi:hypothetical protein